MIHGEQRGSRSETWREMEGDRREPHGGGTETERDTEDKDRSHRNRVEGPSARTPERTLAAGLVSVGERDREMEKRERGGQRQQSQERQRDGQRTRQKEAKTG